MFLKVYTADIIEGLQKAANILPQRTGAAYLRVIWLKAENGNLEILATDSSLEFRGKYSAEILEPGLAGVNGRSFVELLRRLPEGQISLRLDPGQSVLHIEQGRRKYKLPINDPSWFQNFSDFPEAGAVLWSGDYLQELIEKIYYCLGDESTDAISCLIMKPVGEGKIEAAGMNGHQFALVDFVHDDLHGLLPDAGILIQKKYLSELKKWLGSDEINFNHD
jgi:DNA polymerase-3 subunit beta